MNLRKLLSENLDNFHKNKSCKNCGKEFEAELSVGYHPGDKKVVFKTPSYCPECIKKRKFFGFIVDIEFEIPDYSLAKEKGRKNARKELRENLNL